MAGKNRLKVGQQAPEFSVETIDGKPVSLSELRGGPVWLAFFRYAACPLCNFRIHQLLSIWPQAFSGRNFKMFGVFQSPGRKLEGLVKRHDPPFGIISDTKLELYTEYRLETKMKDAFGKEVREVIGKSRKEGMQIVHIPDGPPSRVPADFLIDQHGMIQNAFYGENIAQHIPFEDVSNFLEAQGC